MKWQILNDFVNRQKCGDPASSQMEKLALTEEEQHDASKFKKTYVQ